MHGNAANDSAMIIRSLRTEEQQAKMDRLSRWWAPGLPSVSGSEV